MYTFVLAYTLEKVSTPTQQSLFWVLDRACFIQCNPALFIQPQRRRTRLKQPIIVHKRGGGRPSATGKLACGQHGLTDDIEWALMNFQTVLMEVNFSGLKDDIKGRKS